MHCLLCFAESSLRGCCKLLRPPQAPQETALLLWEAENAIQRPTVPGAKELLGWLRVQPRKQMQQSDQHQWQPADSLLFAVSSLQNSLPCP